MAKSKTVKPRWEDKKRPNKNAKIPYGYRASQADCLVLVPNPEIVVFVEQAMDYLDSGNSYREAARWLSSESGETISHQGLANIWKRHRGSENERVRDFENRRKSRNPKSKEGRELQALKRKQASAKRSLTVAKRKLEKVTGNSKETTELQTQSFSDKLDFDAEEIKTQNVVFTPNSGPQTDFLAASESCLLYTSPSPRD